FANVLAFSAGALAAFSIYSLFGFRYAIVAAALLAGANAFVWSPFGFGYNTRIDPVESRLVSALIFAVIFLVAREMRRRSSESRGEDWAVVQVATFGACYLVLNVIVSSGTLGLFNVTSGWFYWCSYVLTWVLPPLALWMGIRERDRLMMDGAGIAVLATL